MTQQQEEKLKDLAVKYKIDLKGNPPYNFNTRMMIEKHGSSPEELHINKFNIFFMKDYDISKKSTLNFYSEHLEMAELIQLLNQSILNSSTLKISTRIKNVKNEVELNSSFGKVHMWHLMNTLLEHSQDGLYQYEFGIPFKNNVSDDKEELYLNYTEAYSDHELNQIIQFENESVKNRIKHNKENTDIRIRLIIKNFKEDNVFDTNKKTITTNEACFIYDSLDMLEVILGDKFANNQEKYQYIKRILR